MVAPETIASAFLRRMLRPCATPCTSTPRPCETTTLRSCACDDDTATVYGAVHEDAAPCTIPCPCTTARTRCGCGRGGRRGTASGPDDDEASCNGEIDGAALLPSLCALRLRLRPLRRPSPRARERVVFSLSSSRRHHHDARAHVRARPRRLDLPQSSLNIGISTHI